MTVQNAIKKLSKVAPVKHIERQYFAQIGNHIVSFYANGEDSPQSDATCFHVKRVGEKDDLMSDYFCGTYCDNLTQAIRYATNWSK